jgi:hypothetical protein
MGATGVFVERPRCRSAPCPAMGESERWSTGFDSRLGLCRSRGSARGDRGRTVRDERRCQHSNGGVTQSIRTAFLCGSDGDPLKVRELAQPWKRLCRWSLQQVRTVGLPVRFAGLAAPAGLRRRMASCSPRTCVRVIRPLLLTFALAALSPASLRRCWRQTVTLTLLIVVNVALAAAIVVALFVVMTSFARVTHQQPAASSTAPPGGPAATDLPRGPGLTRVPRAARPVRARAQASVRA